MSRGKSFLAVLCSAVLLLPINLNIASAAVKPGDTCPKLKSTSTVKGIKYTCIKSGNKLVWNKGVKVAAKPTPAATPPTPVVPLTPTTTLDASLESIRLAAIANNTYYASIDGCHSQGINAELQSLVDGNWKLLKGAVGWLVSANCPSAQPVQPWTVVNVPEGTTLRWRFWFTGLFDLNGPTFTSSLKKTSTPVLPPTPVVTPKPAPVVTPTPGTTSNSFANPSTVKLTVHYQRLASDYS
jgi:hypothetical protein